MKRTMRDRAGDFMAGKGFYIVLLLCVAALGASGYYLFSGMTDDPGRAVSGPATVVVTPTPVPRPVTTPASSVTPPTTAAPTPVPTAPPVPEATAPAVPTPAATATASVFTWPVKGEVLQGYTGQSLAYNETLRDWRVHLAVDIAAPEGTQVMAPAGGTVTDIYTDDMLGTVVEILHADNVISACANLGEITNVEIGDVVRTGDVIGAVGATAIGEISQVPHLHLAMTHNGIDADPLDYLPRN